MVGGGGGGGIYLRRSDNASYAFSGRSCFYNDKIDMTSFLVLLRHFATTYTPSFLVLLIDTHREMRLNPRGGDSSPRGGGVSYIVLTALYSLQRLGGLCSLTACMLLY